MSNLHPIFAQALAPWTPKRRASLDTVDTVIAGIPCMVEVTHYRNVRGSYSYNAPSDLDYYGYVECDYEVLDRRGYRAAWLERKLTDADRARILEDITEHFGD